MAATIGSFTAKPAGLRKWVEATLIGIGLIGLFVLAIVLYLGLAF